MKQINNYVSVPGSIGGVKRFRKSARGDYAKITYLTEYLLSGVKNNFFFGSSASSFLITVYLILVWTPRLNI